MVRLVESTSEQIQWMRQIASQDTKFNTGKYNAKAIKYIIVEDGQHKGFVQLIPCFFVDGLYLDQALPLKEKARIMTETIECLDNTGNKYVWTVKRYIDKFRKIKHTFANKLYHRYARKFDLRKLDLWYKF